MNATAVSPLKNPAFLRSLSPGGKDMPKPVASWLLENLKLSHADQTRLDLLYNKQMEHELSDEESRELDELCDVVTVLDIMRVNAVVAAR